MTDQTTRRKPIRKGLERIALDLHVHTPASGSDWQGGQIQPSDLVEKALAVGLDGVAITDHSTGQWVDEVKEAAKGTRLLVIPAERENPGATTLPEHGRLAGDDFGKFEDRIAFGGFEVEAVGPERFAVRENAASVVQP